MRFSHDRRGQSVVIGTVILFGFLILALASYQAFAVPAQNNQVEFGHSQDLQSDMEDLRASLLDVRDARQNPYQQPVRISLGTRYESRLFAVNPPPPDGALSTQDRGDINISGASVVNEHDFTNTTPVLNESHSTRLLTYRPNYNEYRNPPRTTFEHSLLYNRFDGANQSVTGQRTVDGEARRLSLVTYSGDIDRQRLSTTLDPKTLDGPTPTIPIESENGDEFTVTLPTHSTNMWEDILDDEPNVTVVEPETTTSSITIELNGTWELQMARVGYDGGSVEKSPFSNVTRVDDERADGTVSRIYDVEWDGSNIAVQNNGVEYDPEQNRLLIDEDANTIQMSGTVTEGGTLVHDATVDFATTNPDVARFDSGPGTNSTVNGDFETTLTVDNIGESTLYAASGDDVDRVQVEIASDDGDDESLPPNAVAYHDENTNGRYDEGEETYTVTDLDGLGVDGSLIVSRDAVMEDGSLGGIEIDAERIVVEDGVELRTTGGGQDIELTSTGDILLTNAEIQSAAPITADASGQLNAQGTSIVTTGGGSDTDLTSGELMNLNFADIQSVAPITIDAGGQFSAQGASIVATGGGSDVMIDSGASINMSDAEIEAINIELDSNGFINLKRTSLAAASFGELSADLTGNADLFVEDAEFTSGGDPTNLIYGPGRSVNVIGEPALGGTSN